MTLEISKESTIIAIITLAIIYTLVLSPISLYYGYKLWTLNVRNVPFITKRHPRVVILSVLLFNIYTVIIRPFDDLTRLYEIELGLFGVLLSNLSQIGMSIISLRVWLLYYDYNHELQALALKWKTQITKQEDKIPWTTKYKWMGNVQILLLISGIFESILLAITMICYGIFGPISLNYTILIPSCYVIFILIMIFKIRTCRDEFCVQKEFKLLFLWMLVGLVTYLAFIAPFFPVTSNIRLLAMNIWICSGAYIFSMVPTYWVITQFYKQIIFKKSDEAMANNNEKKLSLDEILGTKDGFDIFANHLIREFSIENLFFVFEMIQTKNELIANNLVNDEDVGYMISIDLGRMDKIRRVNFNVNDITDLRKSVQYIMEQYIYSGSEYCVNISSFTRLAILDAYNRLEGDGKLVVEMEIVDIESEETQESTRNKDQHIDFMHINKNDMELIKTYVVIFDKAMQEIINLLKTDSLQRFYMTKEYKTMIQRN